MNSKVKTSTGRDEQESVPKRRRTKCRIAAIGKRRDEKMRYWCTEHKADATAKYGVPALACANADPALSHLEIGVSATQSPPKTLSSPQPPPKTPKPLSTLAIHAKNTLHIVSTQPAILLTDSLN